MYGEKSKKNLLHIWVLKSSGPKLDPCGTLYRISLQEL